MEREPLFRLAAASGGLEVSGSCVCFSVNPALATSDHAVKGPLSSFTAASCSPLLHVPCLLDCKCILKMGVGTWPK